MKADVVKRLDDYSKELLQQKAKFYREIDGKLEKLRRYSAQLSSIQSTSTLKAQSEVEAMSQNVESINNEFKKCNDATAVVRMSMCSTVLSKVSNCYRKVYFFCGEHIRSIDFEGRKDGSI